MILSYWGIQLFRKLAGDFPGSQSIHLDVRVTLFTIGLGLGIALALAVTRLISSYLFEVKPVDPPMYALVSIALIAVALAACYMPARRATKVDPISALRYE